MPLQQDLRFEVTVDKTGNDPVIRVKDLTDYGAIPLSNIFVYLSINGPLGVIHAFVPGTPDIDRSVTGVSPNYTLPLTTDDSVPFGNYTVDVVVDESGSGDSFNVEINFEYAFAPPVPKISFEYSCLMSTLKSIDSTNYQVQGYGFIAAVKNHDITWPEASGNPKEFTSSTEVLLGPNIWTGKYYSYLDTRPKYEIQEDVYVVDRVKTGATIKVVCDVDFCSIPKAYKNLIAKRDCLNNKSSGEYQRLNFIIQRVSELLSLAQSSKVCGDLNLLEQVYRQAYSYLEKENCGCSPGAIEDDKEIIPIEKDTCCPNLYFEW